ncbi:CLUMA_CG003247, isoform B [Clunio marinus]|uniref:CLUMA_CG003247, isoform B n=1 Tax=Clunio marinus TaxID=568069 RepID=A0A1J1HNF1_9DIPT|nr:CLUMA_CG003247, isoform B [Clunio marinus]
MMRKNRSDFLNHTQSFFNNYKSIAVSHEIEVQTNIQTMEHGTTKGSFSINWSLNETNVKMVVMMMMIIMVVV